MVKSMETKSVILGAAGVLVAGGLAFGFVATANAVDAPATSPATSTTSQVATPTAVQTSAPVSPSAVPTQTSEPVVTSQPVAPVPAPASAPAPVVVQPAPISSPSPAPVELSNPAQTFAADNGTHVILNSGGYASTPGPNPAVNLPPNSGAPAGK